jgi:hypothetical protein
MCLETIPTQLTSHTHTATDVTSYPIRIHLTIPTQITYYTHTTTDVTILCVDIDIVFRLAMDSYIQVILEGDINSCAVYVID